VAQNGFARVALILIRLQFALHADVCTREDHHRLESRTCVALTVAAMADSAEYRLAAKGVTDAPAQASSGYIRHPTLPLTSLCNHDHRVLLRSRRTRQSTTRRGGCKKRRGNDWPVGGN
jgi:hypothetical protein